MVADTVVLKLWDYVSSMRLNSFLSGVHRMIAKSPLIPPQEVN